mmetsp:Transcript_90420/g.281513  ORF Transcript_90420/g.281513 Transcript_90420/m.281513 type:complete len:82 (-) Transcript_90420:61-306(-)|eukprot:CAMPEP_0204606424 /NCGR_PEP_ID=MMETSP0661-20131031/59085_1 /ASSEMBLY_ACC=CAM_ASM_000606 /TAXON_ID=109239 /ORGANISM="Alexandrium margalefi, Strain AMGDE01CS-322" /LENGTH=81 /DNA_ID=CAMNT_0051617751 /DNA_START=53 /DNA_END=298 /DNA_ORIENTATION=-
MAAVIPPGGGGRAGKVLALAVAGTTLLGFHYVLITERERREQDLRQRIQSLHEEVGDLKAQLKEERRAHFLGRPHPGSAAA